MKKLLAPISIAVALASSFAACTQGESTYPQAEWDYAKAILMHTPGEELFDGVAHPYAGLFEYYFDVDKAAKEHQGYMDALERNGIEVYTVHELLGQVPMEKLRDCARQALTYDTSALPDSADCRERGLPTEHHRSNVACRPHPLHLAAPHGEALAHGKQHGDGGYLYARPADEPLLYP